MVKTAMIIEDCKLTLHMTKFLLMKLGIETIFTASNMNEFKKFITKEVMPDIVITDWNIDKYFKGYDVISEITKLGMPIAIVSSDDNIEIGEGLNRRYHCFKKPLDLKGLSSWIQTI